MHTFQINVWIQFIAFPSTCFTAYVNAWKTYHKKLLVQMMINTRCSKHVEGTKSWIETLIWNLRFVGVRYTVQKKHEVWISILVSQRIKWPCFVFLRHSRGIICCRSCVMGFPISCKRMLEYGFTCLAIVNGAFSKPLCCIRGVPHWWHKFPHCLLNSTIFGEKFLKIKCVFFIHTFYLKHFSF